MDELGKRAIALCLRMEEIRAQKRAVSNAARSQTRDQLAALMQADPSGVVEQVEQLRIAEDRLVCARHEATGAKKAVLRARQVLRLAVESGRAADAMAQAIQCIDEIEAGRRTVLHELSEEQRQARRELLEIGGKPC